MKVLIIGGGGREHALAWKATQSPLVDHVYIAPGNGGTATDLKITNVPIMANAIQALATFASDTNIGLTIVGPEIPLAHGIVDAFEQANLRCFGPRQAAAQLESSKTFSKNFLARHRIPTAKYQSFTSLESATSYIKQSSMPLVIKANGLAAGKGVVIAQNETAALAAAQDMLCGSAFGTAGQQIIIEEFLEGEEASFIVMVDGKNILPLATSQDHKARDNGDQGPNTGGMGAYSPAPVVTEAMHRRIMTEVIEPTVNGLREEGTPYTGFLYAGIMIAADGTPNVLEFNCRFGDPETQPIMMRLKSDLVALCLAALDQKLDTTTADWDERAALGVVMAANGYPESYKKGLIIQGLPREKSSEKMIFHAGTEKYDHHIITSGGRVLCATALGQNVSEAQQRAYELVEEINWEGAFYRTDIGYRAIAREQQNE